MKSQKVSITASISSFSCCDTTRRPFELSFNVVCLVFTLEASFLGEAFVDLAFLEVVLFLASFFFNLFV